MTHPRVHGYLGWSRYLRYRTVANLEEPWGWKSPVTTYMLPLWQELFPEVKVIHLCRHGVDVAHSLHMRAEWEQQTGQHFHRQRRLLYQAWPKRGDLNRFLSCMPLERGFSLWEAYVSRAQHHAQALGENARTLYYEEVLADPVSALESLVRFCGLSASKNDIRRIAGHARRERAYAYQAHPELRQFAQRMAPRLDVHGYTPFPSASNSAAESDRSDDTYKLTLDPHDAPTSVVLERR